MNCLLQMLILAVALHAINAKPQLVDPTYTDDDLLAEESNNFQSFGGPSSYSYTSSSASSSSSSSSSSSASSSSGFGGSPFDDFGFMHFGFPNHYQPFYGGFMQPLPPYGVRPGHPPPPPPPPPKQPPRNNNNKNPFVTPNRPVNVNQIQQVRPGQQPPSHNVNNKNNNKNPPIRPGQQPPPLINNNNRNNNKIPQVRPGQQPPPINNNNGNNNKNPQIFNPVPHNAHNPVPYNPVPYNPVPHNSKPQNPVPYKPVPHNPVPTNPQVIQPIPMNPAVIPTIPSLPTSETGDSPVFQPRPPVNVQPTKPGLNGLIDSIFTTPSSGITPTPATLTSTTTEEPFYDIDIRVGD